MIKKMFKKAVNFIKYVYREVIDMANQVIEAKKEVSVAALSTAETAINAGRDIIINSANNKHETVMAVGREGKNAVMAVGREGKNAVMAVGREGKNAVMAVGREGKNAVMAVGRDLFGDSNSKRDTAIILGFACIGLFITAILDKRNDKEELNYDEQ